MNHLRHLYESVCEFFSTHATDWTASLTISTMLGAIPTCLLSLYCIYHTPLLNGYQSQIEELIYQPMKNAQTEQALATIEQVIPSALDFSLTTLFSLLFFSVFFVLSISHTLCKINRQEIASRLSFKILIILIASLIAAVGMTELYPQWGKLALISSLFKFTILSALLTAILPKHPPLLILKTVCLIMAMQFGIGYAFVEYYYYINTYHLIYGQAAGFIMLISWIYISWAIIVFALIHNNEQAK